MKFVPSPKWKLVVDIGTPSLKANGSALTSPQNRNQEDPRAHEVLSLVGEYMPLNSCSPLAAYLPGFTALRLMLMKTNRTPRESEVLGTILGSYSSYVASGRPGSEIAWLLARDCMHLTQQSHAAHSARVHVQGSGALTIASHGIGVNNFEPTSLHRMQGIEGMPQPGTRPMQPSQQQNPLLPAMPLHDMGRGMASAPGAPSQQDGQHASSNGTFGLK